jgi:AraC family transcriptional regulator of adaptative response / DNA-3-methyladenine glycosylase II
MPRSRGETIRALARAVCDGRISFEGVIDSEYFLERLMEIPGIGKWTAQYVAMRALGEPDAFPVGDAAVLSALDLTVPAELERRAEAWRPWRAYATMYLWNATNQSAVLSWPRKQSKNVTVMGASSNRVRRDQPFASSSSNG